MNFKEALIAHLQGEKVEKQTQMGEKWIPFEVDFEYVTMYDMLKDDFASLVKFRLAPRTIFVNGVEVPAPESVAPEMKQYFFCPVLGKEEMWWTDYWANTREDQLLLKRGLIYLNKEDAIARAKAMLLTSDR